MMLEYVESEASNLNLNGRVVLGPSLQHLDVLSFLIAGEATPMALFPWLSIPTVRLSLSVFPTLTKVG